MTELSEMWVWPNHISASSCTEIIQNVSTLPFEVGVMGNSNELEDGGYRNTEVAWLSSTDILSTLLFNHILLANQKAGWNYAIDTLDPVQIGRYGPGARYKIHQDTSATLTPPRKITAVLMLSDPADYEGGVLKLGATPKPTVAPNTQGTIIVFPSTTAHEVTEITAGVRYTAVAWARGPNWV